MALEAFDPMNPVRDMAFSCGDRGDGGCLRFLADELWYAPEDMMEQMENRFNRITLVNKALTERLTIDTGIRFHNIVTDNSSMLDGVVVIELKRSGLSISPILSMLRSLRVKPMGFSKYCIGSALTNPMLRQNRLKPRIRKINRILEYYRW